MPKAASRPLARRSCRTLGARFDAKQALCEISPASRCNHWSWRTHPFRGPSSGVLAESVGQVRRDLELYPHRNRSPISSSGRTVSRPDAIHWAVFGAYESRDRARSCLVSVGGPNWPGHDASTRLGGPATLSPSAKRSEWHQESSALAASCVSRSSMRQAPNPSIERTSQMPLRALWSTAHVER